MSLIQGVWDGKEVKEQREREEEEDSANQSPSPGSPTMDGLTKQMANSKVGKP